MNATLPSKVTVTSKKPFTPPTGPITGLVVSWIQDKQGAPKVLRIETVRGSFQAKLAKPLRSPLSHELTRDMPVRLWLRVKGQNIRAEMVVPLEAKQVIEGPCNNAPSQACIWVCTSKSCCKKGGSELLQKLKEVASEQPNCQLEVKKCGCLGTCKKGPSLKIKGDRKVHQVTPCAVPQWINKVISSPN